MNKRNNSDTTPLLPFSLFLTIAVLIGALFVLVLVRLGSDWNERAAMGEMLAGVGAILSVFSFGALLFTVFIQHRQYELQRKELIGAHEAQKQAAQALSQQIKMLGQSAECQALNTLVIQAEETINRFNEARHRGNPELVKKMEPDMANVSERRSKYVERLRVIVAELAKDHLQ